MKRVALAMFLFCILLCFSVNADVIDSGTCGENVTWKYETGEKLIISGSGRMDDWSDGNSSLARPWQRYEVEKLVVEEGITHIGDYAFFDLDVSCCYLPTTLTSIGKDAFAECDELHTCADVYEIPSAAVAPDRETLVIPDSVAEIGNSAFYGSDLKKVVLPEKLKVIGYSVFRECEELERVEIPDGVERIDAMAFACCESLKFVVIPKSVVYIGSGAFDDWEDIEGDWGNDMDFTIGYKGTKEEWNAIEKDSDNKNLKSERIIMSYEDGNSDRDDGFSLIGVLAFLGGLLVVNAIVAGIVVAIIFAVRKKKRKS